ncbi:MAG: hypothetical protein JWP57_4617, partial [Spirosoma sp.]|nr:hypothetical protein [Spirosoma sp.]
PVEFYNLPFAVLWTIAISHTLSSITAYIKPDRHASALDNMVFSCRTIY